MRDRQALGELDRLAAQAARHAQLVEAERCGGCFELRADVDGRIQPHVDRDRERLARGFRLLPERVDVAAGREEDRHLVGTLHAQAVDGDVDVAGIVGVRAQHQPHAEIGAGVLRRVGRRRQELAQVEAVLVRAMHHLLAGHLAALHVDRRCHELAGLPHLLAQFARRRPEQPAHPLPARQQPDEDASVRVALDVVEAHRRPEPRRPHDGAPGTHAAVDARELVLGVDLVVGLQILTLEPLQMLERHAGPAVAGLGEVDQLGVELPVLDGHAVEPLRDRGADATGAGAAEDDVKLEGQDRSPRMDRP